MHKMTEPLGRNIRVVGDKLDDPLLHPVKIREGLRHTKYQAVHPHRVDGRAGIQLPESA